MFSGRNGQKPAQALTTQDVQVCRHTCAKSYEVKNLIEPAVWGLPTLPLALYLKDQNIDVDGI